ncbi:MAG TPA: LysM domain-containing protein, partial [Anaerolineaceae bacterium]
MLKPVLRMLLSVVLLSAFALTVWEVGGMFLPSLARGVSTDAPPAPSPTPGYDLAAIPLPELNPAAAPGVARQAQLHTTLPERPRFELSKYTVQQGDTVFGIAEKFQIKPQTIMWGNTYVLGDDPDMISPGLELTILPEDGALYRWTKGDGLNGVAAYFHV